MNCTYLFRSFKLYNGLIQQKYITAFQCAREPNFIHVAVTRNKIDLRISLEQILASGVFLLTRTNDGYIYFFHKYLFLCVLRSLWRLQTGNNWT